MRPISELTKDMGDLEVDECLFVPNVLWQHFGSRIAWFKRRGKKFHTWTGFLDGSFGCFIGRKE